MKFSNTRRNTMLLGAAALSVQPLRFAHAAEVLKIGVLVPLTGAHASDGSRLLKAHKLAAKQINAAGGIKELGGAKVELVVGDTQSKPEVSRSEAERLISSLGVSALVGAWASATTIPAAQVSDRNKTPFIVTSAVNDAITEQGMQFVFRVAPKAKWYGDYVADFVDELRGQGTKISRIALCTEDGPAGQAVHANYSSVFPKRGMEIVADETFRTGSPDFSTIVSKLKASGAQALMTLAYADDSAVLLRAMASQRYRPVYIGFGGAHVQQTVLAIGKAAENTYGVVEWNPDLRKPASQDFVKEFAAEYPGETPLSNQPQAFATIYLIAMAAGAAKSTDPVAIRDALRGLKISSGPASLLPVQELAFDGQGQAKADCVMVQAIAGKFVTVFPKAVATRPPVLPE